MPYSIHIHNLQKRIPVQQSHLKTIICRILEKEGIHQVELSVVLTTDRRIQMINKKFLDHDFPTDVITFDLSSDVSATKQSSCMREVEGEIYVSAMTAVRQAKVYGVPPAQELLLYIVHGILHLLGYDDHSAADRKRMREKEKEMLNFLNKAQAQSSSSRKAHD